MDRKAISPIIAVILLIIVVVALVIVLYGFAVGVLGGTSTAVTETQTGMTGTTSTGRIEEVDLDADIIYVRATNSLDSIIDSVYIDGERFECTGSQRTLNPPGTTVVVLELTGSGGNCDAKNIVSNQRILIAGSNNLSISGKS